MHTIILALKTDKELKEQAQEIAADLGFSLNALLNAYLRQLVKYKMIYFSAEPATYRMSEWLEKELQEIEKDIKQGRNFSPPLKDEEAVKYLKEL